MLAALSRAATADARCPTAYRNRAEAHLELGHYAEAIEDLSRAIAFDAGNAELYVLRGHGYLASDNTASALKDFARVLECRFPTVQDYRTPRWQKTVLRELARWRWATKVYGRPLELAVARRHIGLRRPQVDGL